MFFLTLNTNIIYHRLYRPCFFDLTIFHCQLTINILYNYCELINGVMDKIKSAKSLQYNDRYSKNPIINNLIKAKLENEIGVVKDNFSQILKR